MIKTLGLESVAEGVETREQADAMLGMGCDEAQGYYFARPIDAAGMDAFLEGGAVWDATDVRSPEAEPQVAPPIPAAV
jgi:EAL domain-containing protein (putative c-di-GMP-specific phosphodiesterase class I)